MSYTLLRVHESLGRLALFLSVASIRSSLPSEFTADSIFFVRPNKGTRLHVYSKSLPGDVTREDFSVKDLLN